MLKLAVIIQARMGSTRLPNKVMAEILGKPMLWHLISRIKQSKYNPEIIIATSISEEDKQILQLAKDLNIKSFAGSVDDVLDRFYQAALKFRSETFVRITADCPLIDPKVFDEVVKAFLVDDVDFTSNTHPPTYPDGLDVEVFSFKTLEKTWKEAKLSSEREHVTAYMWKNPNIFKLNNVYNDFDIHELRWTVDEKEDLLFVKEVYRNLYPKKKNFLMADILNLLVKKPELSEINNNIVMNDGYIKSLREDRKVK